MRRCVNKGTAMAESTKIVRRIAALAATCAAVLSLSACNLFGTPDYRPQVADGAWLDEHYAEGVQDPIEFDGNICAISRDQSIIVTEKIQPKIEGPSELVGWNIESGEVQWSVTGATCGVVDHAADIIYSGGEKATSFDITSGEEKTAYPVKWPAELPEGREWEIYPLSVGDGVLLLGNPGVSSGEIDWATAAVDVASGDLLWIIDGEVSPIGECEIVDIEGAPVICLDHTSSYSARDARTGEDLGIPFGKDGFYVLRDGIVMRDGEQGRVYDFDGTPISVTKIGDGKGVISGLPFTPWRAVYSVSDLFLPAPAPLAVDADGRAIDFQHALRGATDGSKFLAPHSMTKDARVGVFPMLLAEPKDSSVEIVTSEDEVVAVLDVEDLDDAAYLLSSGLVTLSGVVNRNDGEGRVSVTRLYLPGPNPSEE